MNKAFVLTRLKVFGALISLIFIIGCATTSPPLHEAIIKGDVESAKSLITQNEGIDDTDKYGRSALHLAALKGRGEIVDELTGRISVEKRDNSGWTPLMCASQGGYLEIVKELAARGADLGARNNGGGTPISIAAYHGRKNIVSYLISRGVPVDCRDNTNETPLIKAAYMGHPDAAGLLLANGANLNARTNAGNTALMLAAKNGRLQVVKLLASKGANIEAKNNLENTALFMAAAQGRRDVVEFLLDSGAKIDARNSIRGTPLMVACENGHPDVVELLIERGANVNAKNAYGKANLFIAVYNEREMAAETLVRAGAELVIYDYDESVEENPFLHAEALYKTGFGYKAAAQHYRKAGDAVRAIKYYETAEEYFDRASTGALKGSMWSGVGQAFNVAGAQDMASKMARLGHMTDKYLEECRGVLACYRKFKERAELTRCLLDIPETPFVGRFRVTEVLSGDTIKGAGHGIETVIRIVGIDAPDASGGEPFGRDAAAFLSEMVLGREIDFKGYRSDNRRGLLGAVFLDGVDVHLKMLSAGLARGYLKNPKKDPSRFNFVDWAEHNRVQKEAFEAKKGVWSR